MTVNGRGSCAVVGAPCDEVMRLESRVKVRWPEQAAVRIARRAAERGWLPQRARFLQQELSHDSFLVASL